jgi:DNA repair protein RecO (recombination protein O)
MAAEIDEGICIRHWEWSETSQTVALFSRGHGVVRALAKGSRRPKAPYSGGVELLTSAEFGLIVRPQSDLALLTYWDLRRTFPALRTVLAAHNAGMFVADMILQFVRDHDPHPGLYESTLATLERMQSAAEVPAALLAFQWSLLGECGFRPQIDADVRTGEAFEGEGELLFHPGLGGLLGSKDTPAEITSSAWRVRAETVAMLRRVADEGVPPGEAPVTAVERANRLLASYGRYVLGYQTSTMTVLFGDRLAQ